MADASQLLASARGPRFIERILTARERAGPRPQRILQCVSGSPGTSKGARDPSLWRAAEFLAGRFAAKEAIIKAYSRHGLTFHDMEIWNGAAPAEDEGREAGEEARDGQAPAAQGRPPASAYSSGPPVVYLRRHVGMQRQRALLSISHDEDYAWAVCLALQVPQDEAADR